MLMFFKALPGHGVGEFLLSWNTIPPPFLKGGGWEGLSFQTCKRGEGSDFSHEKEGVSKLGESF